jgi:prepilin-type N-terminal cleavage/methylation domain-containing protein
MRSKGFTLIELAVVLAIIAVLAAVLTPMVSGYLDQARTARAQADVRTIADAIKLYNRDTGRWPIYDGTSNDYSTDAPEHVELGTNGTATPTAGGGWLLNSSTLGGTSLEIYINNDLTGVGTAAFPRAGFRGPYIGTVDTDPWGHRYLLNAGNLRYKAPNNGNHAYIISAGPDGILQTNRDVPTTQNITASGDDIIALIK